RCRGSWFDTRNVSSIRSSRPAPAHSRRALRSWRATRSRARSRQTFLDRTQAKLPPAVQRAPRSRSRSLWCSSSLRLPPWKGRAWSLLRHAEGEDRLRLQPLAGTQNRRRKGRLVRRVGEMLGLQAQAGAALVDAAGLAGDRAIEKIAGIELNARLGGRHVERAA